ncbi:MAG TPA: hypothetical protein DIW61_12355, partial [Candidatus Aminicenantes bacterium]|nr:hypothetical protein [Candidatus Aminicenantes bacterium]
MEPDPDLKRVFRTTIIINGALVASLFLDAFIVELIKFQLKPFPGLLVSGLRHQTLRYLFFGAAVGAVVLVRLAGRALPKMTPGEGL